MIDEMGLFGCWCQNKDGRKEFNVSSVTWHNVYEGTKCQPPRYHRNVIENDELTRSLVVVCPEFQHAHLRLSDTQIQMVKTVYFLLTSCPNVHNTSLMWKLRDHGLNEMRSLVSSHANLDRKAFGHLFHLLALIDSMMT